MYVIYYLCLIYVEASCTWFPGFLLLLLDVVLPKEEISQNAEHHRFGVMQRCWFHHCHF